MYSYIAYLFLLTRFILYFIKWNGFAVNARNNFWINIIRNGILLAYHIMFLDYYLYVDVYEWRPDQEG